MRTIRNVDVVYLGDEDFNQSRIYTLENIDITTSTTETRKAIMMSSVAIYQGEYGKKLIKSRY